MPLLCHTLFRVKFRKTFFLDFQFSSALPIPPLYQFIPAGKKVEGVKVEELKVEEKTHYQYRVEENKVEENGKSRKKSRRSQSRGKKVEEKIFYPIQS